MALFLSYLYTHAQRLETESSITLTKKNTMLTHPLRLGLVVMLIALSCAGNSIDRTAIEHEKPTQEELAELERAYFASGCFWCVEAIFESVEGVSEAVSGYAGGHTTDPTYRSIGTGQTGHAEAVEVYYDPAIVDYETLVKVFYGSHDPTTVNGQAPDFGSQYRSMILYTTAEEKAIAEEYKAKVAADYSKPIATEIVPLEKFYKAEEYHQDYERLNPNEPYVRSVSVPRLERFKEKHPELLKKGH